VLVLVLVLVEVVALGLLLGDELVGVGRVDQYGAARPHRRITIDDRYR
jgi:hypothetical protein